MQNFGDILKKKKMKMKKKEQNQRSCFVCSVQSDLKMLLLHA